MDRRKSTFGTGTCGLVPVKLDLTTGKIKSPLGSGNCAPAVQPGVKRTTPGFGMRRRVGLTPVRPSDLPSKEASILFSLNKSPSGADTKISQPPTKTRRCLYQDGAENKQPRSERKSTAPSKPTLRSLRAPVIRVTAENKTRIPKPASVKRSHVSKSKIVSQSSQSEASSAVKKRVNNSRTTVLPVSNNVLKPSNSGPSQVETQLLQVVEKQQKLLEEQQVVLQEQQAVLLEHRNVLEDLKSVIDAHKKTLNASKASDDFTAIERAIAESEDVSKEDIVGQSASEVAYRQMRRSFRCLGTPTVNCSIKKTKTPKCRTPLRTPRTSLSNKVRAQLRNLLDE